MTPHEHAGRIRYALEQARQTCAEAEDTITVEAIDEALTELRLLLVATRKARRALERWPA